MAEFLSDPSVLTKDKLKSALVANNVALPNGEQRKGVYVELYLKNLTSQNKKSGGTAEAFSSDEEPSAASAASITARSGRKATRKTDRVRPEEIDVTELTNEELKDQLLKYGVNAGPIVASTRKVYEKKLQKLLDQGPPQTTILTVSEPVQTHNSRNGNADSDQYSDKEEETTTLEPELELDPEPEPVPVVERPLRSRGKTPVTTRTRSSQHKEEEDELEEDDLHVVNIKRKSRRSSRRLDHSVPDPVSVSEKLPVPVERKRFSAIPKDPNPLLADMPICPSVSLGSSQSPKRRTASDYDKDISTEKFYKKGHLPVKTLEPRRTPSPSQQRERKLSKSAAPLPEASSEEVQLSFLNTAVLEVGPHEVLSSRPGHVGSSQELKSVSSMKRTKRPSSPYSASAQPSRKLIHTMCRLSPSRDRKDQDPPRSHPTRDLSATKSSADMKIEKLSAVEQTPKNVERDVLKELFPNEVLSTPTGISATRRQPIKGAAGRPFSDTWQDNLRPRLTEHRYTTSSYTETRSVPRVSVAPLSASLSTPLSASLFTPLSAPKPAAPPSVQTKAGRRVPVWVQLLLLAVVVGFLLFVYQAMESNQMSPFVQPGHSSALGNSGK